MEEILFRLFVFLVASSICVPIVKKIGFSSILGYLLAGIIIGPFGLKLTGEVEELIHFTEFGIVMMLFLDGLELSPKKLAKKGIKMLGLGGTQVLLTTLVLGGIGVFFMSPVHSLSLGIILSLSSTALIIQTLKEKGMIHGTCGESVTSVLLFHDLAIIPLLALLPLPALTGAHEVEHYFDVHSLPWYGQVGVSLGAISLIFFIGKYAMRPVFRFIATTRVREIFIGTAISLIVGASLLMSFVGLSPAIGAFVAGVVLADNEYKHEIESDIEPFKGLLLGIFFISIGASINLSYLKSHLLLIIILTIGLMLLKGIILYITATLLKMPKKQKLFFSVTLAQGGEFTFVLLYFSKNSGVLPSYIIEPLVIAVALSMFLTPLVLRVYDKWVLIRDKKIKKGKKKKSIKEKLKIPTKNKVILAGFGRVGVDTGRLLISAGIKPTIIDNDPSNIQLLRKFGFEVYYGDATRIDLLESAGIKNAKLLIVSVGDVEGSIKLIKLVKKHYPSVKIIASAMNRSTTYDIMDLEIDSVRRETFGASLELGKDALGVLGYNPHEAYKLMRIFKREDERELPRLHKAHREDATCYISSYRDHLKDLEELMTLDEEKYLDEEAIAWTTKGRNIENK